MHGEGSRGPDGSGEAGATSDGAPQAQGAVAREGGADAPPSPVADTMAEVTASAPAAKPDDADDVPASQASLALFRQNSDANKTPHERRPSSQEVDDEGVEDGGVEDGVQSTWADRGASLSVRSDDCGGESQISHLAGGSSFPAGDADGAGSAQLDILRPRGAAATAQGGDAEAGVAPPPPPRPTHEEPTLPPLESQPSEMKMSLDSPQCRNSLPPLLLGPAPAAATSRPEDPAAEGGTTSGRRAARSNPSNESTPPPMAGCALLESLSRTAATPHEALRSSTPVPAMGPLSNPSQSASVHPTYLAMREKFYFPQVPVECTRRYQDLYRTETMIGEGTYGRVYKAVHVQTGQHVALKVMKLAQHQEGFPLTSVREIAIANRFKKHKNIACMMECLITEDKEAVLAIEYVDYDLAGILLIGHSLSQKQIISIFYYTLNGIYALHRAGVMHRDLKASNVLISRDGIVKICDFGLSREWAEGDRVTPGLVTRWYRPPEILLDADGYSYKVDVWSAGCLLAEMYIGRPLFQGRSSPEQIQLITDACGSMDPTSWEQGKRRRYNKFDHIRSAPPRPRRLRQYLVERCMRLKRDSKAVNLLDSLLQLDPDLRPTAEKAMEHDFFYSGGTDGGAESKTPHPPKPEPLRVLFQGQYECHEYQVKAEGRRHRGPKRPAAYPQVQPNKGAAPAGGKGEKGRKAGVAAGKGRWPGKGAKGGKGVSQAADGGKGARPKGGAADSKIEHVTEMPATPRDAAGKGKGAAGAAGKQWPSGKGDRMGGVKRPRASGGQGPSKVQKRNSLQGPGSANAPQNSQ